MVKIRFNDSDMMHDVEFSRSDHLVTLRGIVEQNTSGFTTWRKDGVTQLGDFSKFNTVYRVLDDTVQYSDDGSVWADPKPTDPPKPTPTASERITALEDTITALIGGISDAV